MCHLASASTLLYFEGGQELEYDDDHDDVLVIEAGHGRVDSLINDILSWKRPSLNL